MPSDPGSKGLYGSPSPCDKTQGISASLATIVVGGNRTRTCQRRGSDSIWARVFPRMRPCSGLRWAYRGMCALVDVVLDDHRRFVVTCQAARVCGVEEGIRILQIVQALSQPSSRVLTVDGPQQPLIGVSTRQKTAVGCSAYGGLGRDHVPPPRPRLFDIRSPLVCGQSSSGIMLYLGVMGRGRCADRSTPRRRFNWRTQPFHL